MTGNLTIYICNDCARPSLFKEDRCCEGRYYAVEYMPVEHDMCPALQRAEASKVVA